MELAPILPSVSELDVKHQLRIKKYSYETIHRIMGFRHDFHVIVCPVWY